MLQETLGYILIVLGNFSFWLSTGFTEGWKWRIQAGKPDTNRWIKDGTYHIWRLVTNSSVVMLVVGGVLAAPLFPDFTVVSIIAFLYGWFLYEGTISYVEHDDFFYLRPPFRLLGKEYTRPSVLFILFIAVLTTSVAVTLDLILQ